MSSEDKTERSELENGFIDEFPEAWKSKVDARFIFDEDDWREYVTELHEARTGLHVNVPKKFPCFVATAFMSSRWRHDVIDLQGLAGYLRRLAAGVPEEPFKEIEEVVDKIGKAIKVELEGEENGNG